MEKNLKDFLENSRFVLLRETNVYIENFKTFPEGTLVKLECQGDKIKVKAPSGESMNINLDQLSQPVKEVKKPENLIKISNVETPTIVVSTEEVELTKIHDRYSSCTHCVFLWDKNNSPDNIIVKFVDRDDPKVDQSHRILRVGNKSKVITKEVYSFISNVLKRGNREVFVLELEKIKIENSTILTIWH